MTSKRQELKFQDHIVDSYGLAGGYAKKWASEMAVGNPDLVCALPGVGVHLVEVKHRPDWRLGNEYANPLTAKQMQVARDYTKAGGVVFGAVVFGSVKALGAFLFFFDPTLDRLKITRGYEYKSGVKFPVKQILEDMKND